MSKKEKKQVIALPAYFQPLAEHYARCRLRQEGVDEDSKRYDTLFQKYAHLFLREAWEESLFAKIDD